MNGIPHLENQPPAPVRTLVADGKPVDPAMQALIDEKNARANSQRELATPATQIAAAPAAAPKQPGRPPHAESRDELARQALAIVAGGEVVLDIPDGVTLRKFSRRIRNALSKRADTRGYLWSVRDRGHYQVKLTCLGVDSMPAKLTGQIRREKRARKPQDASAPEVVPTILPEPENATVPNSATSGAVLAAEPVCGEPEPRPEAQDAVALVLPTIEVPCDPAVHEARAAFVDSLPVLRFEPLPEAQEPDMARPVAILRIADIVPADPREAAELVDLMIKYHVVGYKDDEDDKWEDNLAQQDELCHAIQRHRRAKQITDALLAAWAADWEFAGTEPPFADLARRIHAALVEVLAAEKEVPTNA